MTVSKAQQRATNKYIAKAYDRVNLTLPKGEKARLQAVAQSRGLSLNAFIAEAIDAALSGSTVQPGGGLTPEALTEAQKAAEAAGETVEAFVERAITTQSKRDKLTRGLARD